MRILYHHRTLAEDGQAVHIRSLQRAFEDEGHFVSEVSLVARGAAPTTRPAETPEPPGTPAGAQPEAPAEPSPASGWGLMSRLPRFARELAEYSYSAVGRARILEAAADFQPDFFYERYAFGNAAGVWAAQRTGTPLVLEVNSPMVLELSRTRGLSFPRIAQRMEAHIFQSADRVCVVTEVLGEMLVELGVERERLFVTPNGVHLEHFGDLDRGRARTALGLEQLGEQEVVLGFVGYYRDWHRLDLVIEALARPSLARAHLALIGEGPAHQSLLRKAHESGVSERVHFTGTRPHGAIPAALPAFDVALVPAINPYASPLKLHEYMAARLATVAPDQPNLRETLTDGVDALLVPPGDAQALAAAIERLVADAPLRERLGAAARATIERRDMTWRGNARRVISAVEELL